MNSMKWTRYVTQPSDFNEGSKKELFTLKSIQDVPGRFLDRAYQYWWAHSIAIEYGEKLQEVKNWDEEDILEALAYINMVNKKKPPQ